MKFLMFSFAVLCVCVCSILSAPLDSDNDEVHIIKYTNENIGTDGYNFAFETSDGVKRKETATLKHVGAISVEGSVSWISPDGVQYTLNYLADEHGFQPQGAHLPVAPVAA